MIIKFFYSLHSFQSGKPKESSNVDEDKAAVVLQSHLKGMMTRKKMMEKKKATTRYSNENTTNVMPN